MAQTTNDIKNGSVLNLDGQLWTVIKFQHVKPGKGPAFVRTTIKNVLSGKIVDKTFNAGMKMEFETVDNRNLQYSYEDGDNFVFMDMTTYDQIFIPKTLVGDQTKFLLEGTDCVVSFHDGTPAVRRAAGFRRPDRHPHRAGPAGQPFQRRHQAGHRRNRRRDPGAAVHRRRREGQGEHHRRLLPRPRELRVRTAKFHGTFHRSQEGSEHVV